MKEIKRDILWRVYLMYFGFLIFGLGIIARVAYIQFVEGDYWKNKAKELSVKYITIDAARGNIYSSDGSLLATSVPIFDVRMDIGSDLISQKYFFSNVDSLAFCLSSLFKNKSKKEYKSELLSARKRGDRYFLIKRDVTYPELKQIRLFPILRLGKYKGGLIIVEKDKREMPFRMLAARTIGYEKGGFYVGLEGSFGIGLQGIDGKRMMQRIANNAWIPLNDENEIEPQNGKDIITTIDINIQDVAENALMKQLISNDADHGCVVLMEVKTGEIKAIANLSRKADGVYEENYNYAVGESSEPGSTFKLASLIVALDDKKVSLTDQVNTTGGETMYFNRKMYDSEKGGHGIITVKQAFELSSNVGISKIIYKSYAADQQRFVDKLYAMNLNKPLGLQVEGEGMPIIKSTRNKTWSKVTLPWMSIGYEVALTPLQILTFYNAIANNGVMVKPMLVREIQQMGKVVKQYKPTVINDQICSKETLRQARILLEGVVENGTGRNLNNTVYKIAGKTGTAQIAEGSKGYNKTNYKASFVGYFPADNPAYSCIVVINNPSKGVYYGGAIAGPVFREVADKVYATQLDIHSYCMTASTNKTAPNFKIANQVELTKVCKDLHFSTVSTDPSADWVVASADQGTVKFTRIQLTYDFVPNVVGMGVKDAVFVLENIGLKVKINGKGAVAGQSIPSGSPLVKNSEIILTLS